MDKLYEAAVPIPEGAVMWGDERPFEGDDGHGAFLEKLYVAIMILVGVVACFLYRIGLTYLALMVAGAPILIGWLINPRIGIYAYCFWQAWDAAIAFGEADQITPAKILAFGVLGISCFHIWRHPLSFTACRSVALWATALCAISLASAMWSFDMFYALRYGLQMLVQLLLLLVIVATVCDNMAHVKRLAFWTFLGGVTAGGWIILYGSELSRFDRASLSHDANPVSAATGIMTGLACAPLLWCLTRSRVMKLLLIVVALVAMVGIVETGTRAAVGGVLGGFAGAAVLTRGRGRIKRIAVISVALIMAYAAGAAVVYSSVLKESNATRLAEFMHLPLPKETSRYAGATEGVRRYVWALALEGYWRSGLMGSGIGTSAWASGAATGHYRDVHSNLLGALVEIGPIGLFAFVGLYVAMGLSILRIRNSGLQVSAWVMLLSSLAVGLAHTTYTTKYFWLPLTFLAVIYELDARRSADADALAEYAPEG